MKYNIFGKTDFKVSDIGFGAWAIGGTAWGGGRNDEDAKAALRASMADGINFYDTCDSYGDGHSEELIGEFFKGIRKEVVIVTKGGTNFRVPERSKNFTRDYLMMSLDESLQRLQTDYVDVYLLHVPDSKWQDEAEIFKTMAEIKKSGKARCCGLAMWGAADTLHALEKDTEGAIEALECPFNILNKSNIEVIKIAKERNIPVFTSQPLASGILTGKYGVDTKFTDGDNRKGFWSKERFEAVRDDMRIIEECVGETGLKMNELALAYNLNYPGICSVIPGGKNEGQVRQNVAASGIELSAEIMRKLASVKGFVF
ncbi:aldo/keto reductase [Ruminiclostridium cellobioparum]|uniref:Oxidoreductase, aldo/keto reductase n=1 Tax=Ruminiclostridium cellobioparum subsp. termitidis CT1112 TaxID=1195236 RepID=S0FNI5_RUMCE|nr:aldo/keto reductase [Ruminiclostridium cellobioparum]EMS70043.1 oxidoreductase, aldo/keto reductase [Ruminiclostridium cellobioparum subsp. termitidis CT1112]